MRQISKAIMLMAVAPLAISSPASAAKFYYREKPAVEKTPRPETPKDETDNGGNTASVSLSGSTRLTIGEAITPLTIGGTLPSGASYRLAGSYAGLVISGKSVSGTPGGSPGDTYNFRVEAVKDGDVIGQSSSFSAVLRDRLHVDTVPMDIDIPAGGSFPNTGIAIGALGGDQSSLTWSLSGNKPAWLDVQAGSNGTAVLTFSGSVNADYDQMVGITVKDGDNRQDSSRQFRVKARQLASGVTVAFGVPNPYPFTKTVNLEITPAASVTDGSVQYRLKSGSASGFYVDNNTGRIWGQPNDAVGAAASLTVEAVQGGTVVGTSNTISGTVRAYFQATQGPNDVIVPAYGTFPTTNISAQVEGGDSATYAWELVNAPAWLEIAKDGTYTAKLKVKDGAKVGTFNGRVTVKVSDGEGRVDTSRGFNVQTEETPEAVPVTLSYPAASPYPFLTNGNYEWQATASETGNGIQFRLKAGSTSNFYVDNNTGRVWGNTGGSNGQAVSITVEAVRNGEVIATSNTISGTVYSRPEFSGSNYWGGQISTRASSPNTVSITGGRAPYTVTLKSGTLPSWAEAVVSGSTFTLQKKASETVTNTPRTSVYYEVTDADGRVMQNGQPAGYKIDIEAY